MYVYVYLCNVNTKTYMNVRLHVRFRMAGVSLEDLWCQCGGNSSATPHRTLIHRQMTKLHATAQRHAIWYVVVVLTLYVLGLVVIIRRSGRTERHTAASALSFCFSRAASTVASRRKRRRGDRQDRPRLSPQSSEPRQQQVVPSLQVGLGEFGVCFVWFSLFSFGYCSCFRSYCFCFSCCIRNFYSYFPLSFFLFIFRSCFPSFLQLHPFFLFFIFFFFLFCSFFRSCSFSSLCVVVHLVVSEDDDEMEISMVTTVA
ncbi:uncharacterized protein LOC126980618 [Eriocheir sinensis]|uniref:uncharacterized protein LOC126980618 n=1 Tax=Eriocheir sinensis TaxID=95602 RepID=UPI0021C7BC84|nr:uncharacterized protein LOC126980618 [Eriocheir sinensis]